MSVDRFYKLEQERLLNEFEKISLFTNHGPTIGTYRENLLHEYIRKFTPNAITVGQGFVIKHQDAQQDALSSISTRQVDCLVYDEHNRAAFLKTKDFAVISPDAIRGAIEVKSTLTFYKTKKAGPDNMSTDDEYPLGGDHTEAYKWEGTLIDSFKNIQSVAKVTDRLPYFSGIFCYQMTFDPRTLLHAFDNEEIQRQLKINAIFELPNYICSLDGSVILFTDHDFLDSEVVDPYTSHITWIKPVDNLKNSFSLQFFTVAYIQQMSSFQKTFNKKTSGLFSVTPNTVTITKQHFNLSHE